jgi:hypothetical protein
MKTLIALLLITPFLQGCGQKPQTGRYQIITGTYESLVIPNNNINNSGPVSSHGIFKIDTETGRTWDYYSGVVVGTNGLPAIVDGWREIK